MLLKRRAASSTPEPDATVAADGTDRSPAPGSAALAEVVAMVDRDLIRLATRQVVAAGEVSDLLLDLRVALVVAEQDALGFTTAAGD